MVDVEAEVAKSTGHTFYLNLILQQITPQRTYESLCGVFVVLNSRFVENISNHISFVILLKTIIEDLIMRQTIPNADHSVLFYFN